MRNLKRRDFLKTSLTVGAGASTLNLNNLTAQVQSDSANTVIRKNPNPKKIIVGGAGIGGMCCAYELMKRGHDVTVLEASGRHGGHVYTARDGLSDGLYGDYGQEHITKPGYDRYWKYIEEFGLTALYYPRRENVLRRIEGVFYNEEQLADPQVLKQFGFNAREVRYLSNNPWWDLRSLYLNPYLEKFTDEYQPFGVGYDDWDHFPMVDIYKKDGASETALRFLGGASTSALYQLWYTAILKLRGVPIYPPHVYRLKGGNQELPNAFAKRLGNRVRLNCPIKRIRHDSQGVKITFQRQDETVEMSADYFVNAIPLPSLMAIDFSPELPAEKQYVIRGIRYDSYQRFVFQAASKFWEEDGLSINMDLNHPFLGSIWRSADEVDTHRVILLGSGPGGISPEQALAAFREVYPGKMDTIEQAVSMDWTRQKFAPNCERLPFPMGELHKFWPQLMEPVGRIHFVGAYADNLNWGTEAATRSANRVAEFIDRA